MGNNQCAYKYCKKKVPKSEESRFYCVKHTCDYTGCYKMKDIFLDKFTNYCKDHQCYYNRNPKHICNNCVIIKNFPERKAMRVRPGQGTCVFHTCKQWTCHNKVYKEMTFCEKHKCPVTFCSGLSLIEKGHCKVHTCKLVSCYNYADTRSNYCKECICHVEGCSEKRTYMSIHCLNHTCDEHNCNEPRIASHSHYCSKHSCKISNCAYPKMDNYEYCFNHKCMIRGCNYRNTDYSDYCLGHMCILESCYDKRTRSSEYCEIHENPPVYEEPPSYAEATAN